MRQDLFYQKKEEDEGDVEAEDTKIDVPNIEEPLKIEASIVPEPTHILAADPPEEAKDEKKEETYSKPKK